MQSIGDEADDIVEPEGRQHDFLNPRSGLADRSSTRISGCTTATSLSLLAPTPGGSEIRSLRIRANPAFLAIQGGDLC